MRSVLYGSDGRLRNGWWALAFLLAMVLAGLVQAGLVKALRAAGVPRGPWQIGVGLLAVLAATWLCTRLRREPLRSVGLRLDGRWARQAGTGVLLGAGQIGLATMMLWGFGGVRFELDPARSLQAIAAASAFFVAAALVEELLFRGFLFQRLRDGLGAWTAQIALAVLFAVAHWSNPGMEGTVKVWATIDIALGALVLGLAYLRTGSLALPFGIHFGWNWMQGPVLGYAVSGTTRHQGWLTPTFVDDPAWFTGGVFGLEASVFAVIVDLGLFVLLLSWRGVADANPTLVEPAVEPGALTGPRRFGSVTACGAPSSS